MYSICNATHRRTVTIILYACDAVFCLLTIQRYIFSKISPPARGGGYGLGEKLKREREKRKEKREKGGEKRENQEISIILSNHRTNFS